MLYYNFDENHYINVTITSVLPSYEWSNRVVNFVVKSYSSGKLARMRSQVNCEMGRRGPTCARGEGGLGFKLQGLGFSAVGFGFRVQFRVQGLWFRI